MAVQNYNLRDACFDNTFKQVSFVLPTDPIYDLTGATAKIQVREKIGGAIFKTYEIGAGLTVTLPYTIVLDEHIIDFVAGSYIWDLKIWFLDGREKTYVGGTWKINNTVTQ